MEIGFGDGRFLVHLVQREPQRNILGLEISHRSLAKAERLLARYDNLRLIHGGAEMALRQLFAPGDLTEVHINFPDPWFKKRHRRRRLLRGENLALLLNRMASGATLHLATDVRRYAEACDDLLQREAGLSNALAAPWSGERLSGPSTKYERKARAAGRECYYFVYRRNARARAAPMRIEEQPLPHLVIRTPISLAETQRAFSPTQHHHTTAQVHFLAIYGAAQALLFEAFVREGNLNQRVGIALARQGPEASHLGGEQNYTLSLSGIGHPRATPGLHLAVALIGRWLLNLHPKAHIIQQRIRAWEKVTFSPSPN